MEKLPESITPKIASYKERLSMRVIECGEGMVNISNTLQGKIICKHENSEMAKYTGDSIWVRKTVGDMLEQVSASLVRLHPAYKLKVVFGFRHPEVQKFYFERRKEILRPANQNLTEDELEELADSMSANPKVAGHAAGAALDITITTPEGDLDMGTGISDFSNIEKVQTLYPHLTEGQKKNRMLLNKLMQEVGFAPYYGEWWHFSYGDREWACFYNKSHAIYDIINFQTENKDKN